MFTLFTYILAATALILSFIKDKGKTKTALTRAYNSFSAILPDFACVLALVGILLTYLSPQIIIKLLGEKTGFLGMFLSSLAGSITLIPGFIAFPLAKSVMERGAGTMQVAVFVSTLMMVGFVTAPLEIKYFGRKETVLRNGLSYIYSFIAAFIIGMVVGA